MLLAYVSIIPVNVYFLIFLSENLLETYFQAIIEETVISVFSWKMESCHKFPQPLTEELPYLRPLAVWLDFPAGASGREPACQCRRHQRCRFDSWVGKIPRRREWLPTQVFLPRKFHGQRSLESYSVWGHKEMTSLSG